MFPDSHPPPVGPLTPQQKRFEAVRRSIVDATRPIDEYFAAMARLSPGEITPQIFDELQYAAHDAHEANRRHLQAMYDLLEYLATEQTNDRLIEATEKLLAIEQAKAERIRIACQKSREKWEAQKAERAPKKRWLSWFR